MSGGLLRNGNEILGILKQDFYSYSRCINRCIASYVRVDTARKTDKITSQIVQVI